jgi:hypothetical protein
MFNKYYRLNESRWELPEENEYFQYPNYGYDKEEYDYIKEKNLKEGWDKHIIKELTKFYNENKDYIVTECDELKHNNKYFYINFPKVTEEEIKKYENKISKEYVSFTPKFPKKYKNYEIRKVIREYSNLNPSSILFSDIRYYYDLSEILNVVIEFYTLIYTVDNKLISLGKDILMYGYWV